MPFHADGFGHRDLHVVDKFAIQQRLENGVGEPKRHHVQHGFFAEVMIDPINLIFLQEAMNIGIERAGTGQIVAKRFFDDDAIPGRLPGL